MCCSLSQAGSCWGLYGSALMVSWQVRSSWVLCMAANRGPLEGPGAGA